ncbi:MAG TPA: undecaprenyl-diphosphatase UppP [Ignavibacteriales bacterium]|nr:undecaprenyl-diphosphatase UppP [Ignavibacteriales bacterium]HOL81450.1 undecaprenyl-diphosphatase UppP [Ignavibacteriales bacterium]HOM65348.1 undecaprenyl-diphosphatase UppP [Ignavibacteriales bacterium]HPP33623.1 undecaprenyl-diphosphatase UppP [Ignavibacteriales bacterium]HRR18864.1 undecaprenyl-diphosphatase UppP [Ignavibacteriales bacterium]
MQYDNILHAIILGIVQGISEFLPISSTGHLTIAGKLLNQISQTNPERWTHFIAIIQLGTMISILVYFFKDLFNIAKDFMYDNLILRKKISNQSQNSKLGWLIILGTLPIVIIGLALKKVIEGEITKNLYLIASMLIIVAIIMFIAEKLTKNKRSFEEIRWKDAVIIGLAQCLALIPGVSRSGSTITAGLFLNIKRDVAARFSFLLSVPAILASGLLELKESLPYIVNEGAISVIVATIVSFISGYLAIDFLIKYLRTKTTLIFIIYRIIVGAAILILLNYRII